MSSSSSSEMTDGVREEALEMVDIFVVMKDVSIGLTNCGPWQNMLSSKEPTKPRVVEPGRGARLWNVWKESFLIWAMMFCVFLFDGVVMLKILKDSQGGLLM